MPTENVYQKYLGITTAGKPDHYALLGVPFKESNPEIIAAAARQRKEILSLQETPENQTEIQLMISEIKDARDTLLDDKKRFNTDYSDLIKRPWHDVKDLTPEEFASFIKECGEVIVKPYDKSWGVGVKKLSAGDIADIDPLYERYKNCLVEKRIVQHPALAAFNPDCVNSLRIVTYVCSDGKPRIAAALLRIGAAGKCADNVANGGSVAEIDIASGVVYTPAVDDGKSKHIFSPVTGAKIIGASIPHWDAIAAAALEAASRRPELRLVGWDIAVTGEGFDFIEGNSCPSIQLLQMASCTGRRDIEAATMRSERGGA